MHSNYVFVCTQNLFVTRPGFLFIAKGHYGWKNFIEKFYKMKYWLILSSLCLSVINQNMQILLKMQITFFSSFFWCVELEV